MNFRMHSLVYFLTGILFIVLEILGMVYPALLVKALIIPILIWLYLRFVRGNSNTFHIMIIISLVFSWGGDVTLQLTRINESFFLIGLSSFLLAQLLYTVAFFSTRGESILAGGKIYLTLPVAAYGVLILWLLWDGLGDMRIPVIVYCVIILLMLTASVNRKRKVNAQSFWLVFLGAALFVISDSILAVNKFTQPFELARPGNMGSYITAQYLIVIGCVRQFGLTLKTPGK